MSELKPCPFCGGVAQVNTWTMHGITESRCFCPNSDCPNSVRTVALATWNTRPIEDALNARIAQLEAELKITDYNDAISAGKVSVDVKTSTDNNKRSKWKAYVPGWGAPAVNKRYLVKLINDWITIATYYLRVGGGYWKNDSGQELADGVVSLWKGLEE